MIKSTPEAIEKYNLKQDILFEQWFEIIDAGNNMVHSTFYIDIKDKGNEVLNRIGVQSILPAVIQGQEDKNFYYFCVDFAVNPAQMWTAKLAGGPSLNHFLYRFNESNKANFFKHFYSPLMYNILEDYYESMSSSNL